MGLSKTVTLRTPLRVNGFTDLYGGSLIPPNIAVDLTYEMAEPSFYLTCNTEEKCIFKMDECYISSK